MKKILTFSLLLSAMLILSNSSYAADTNKDTQVNKFQQYGQKVVKYDSPLYYMMPIEIYTTGTRTYGFNPGCVGSFDSIGGYAEEIQIYDTGAAYRQMRDNRYRNIQQEEDTLVK